MVELCKILFDMCFYYTLSGYYLYITTLNSPLVWGVPAIILSTVVGIILKKADVAGVSKNISDRVRVSYSALFCCVIPGVLFFFNPSLWQIIQFIPAWAYFCFVTLSDRVFIDSIDFKSHFSYTGRILLLMAPGALSFNRFYAAMSGALPYFILYLLVGVCLMRILREKGKLTAGRNVVTLLIMLAGGAVLVLFQAPQFVLSVAGFIYKYIILNVLTGMLYLFGAIFVVIFWFFSKLISFFSSGGSDETPTFENIMEEAFGEDMPIKLVNSPEWLKYIWYAFLALLVAFILFMILRKLIGNKKADEEDMRYREAQDILSKKERKRSIGIFRPRESRHMVRWYYKKYLKESVSRGVFLVSSDTSLSVLGKSDNRFPLSEAERMRGLYINARYSYNNSVSETDVSETAELWKKLKQKHEL